MKKSQNEVEIVSCSFVIIMAARELPVPGAQYPDREKIFGVRDEAKIKEVPLSEAQIEERNH